MNAEEDFQYYVLEKSLNTDFSDFEVIELVDTSYIDMNFTANQTNYYRLTAVDYAGNHSETSPIVEATIMLSIDDHLTPVKLPYIKTIQTHLILRHKSDTIYRKISL